MLWLNGVVTRFHLTCFVNDAYAGTVRMVFITGFRLRAIRLRDQRLCLRNRIEGFNLIIRAGLVRFMATRLFFIRRFLMFHLDALGIRFRGEDASVRAISPPTVGLCGTAVSEEDCGFFGDQYRLSQYASTSLGYAFIGDEGCGVLFLGPYARRKGGCASGRGNHGPGN